jgi:hypothetical protein
MIILFLMAKIIICEYMTVMPGYKFDWKIDTEKASITFMISAQTKGWLALGLSPDGTMAKSDMIMCYMDANSTAKCSDRWSDGYSLPKLDTSLGGKDDLTEVKGSLDNNWLNISFTRKLNTEDKYDQKIIKGVETNLLFSLRKEGNPLTEGEFNMHSSDSSKKLLLWP